MKKLLILLLLSTSFSAFAGSHLESLVDGFCYESVKVQVRNDRFFLPNQSLPYSGENICVYSKNGQYHSQGLITNGKQDGWWTWWKENGELWKKEQYKDGDKTGYKKLTFNENGQIELEKIYLNDKLIGETKYKYYDNGQIKSEENYKDGKQDGKSTGWYENGQISSEGNFKDGTGVYFHFYENGQISSEGNFKDGKFIGETKYIYDKNGQKKFARNYKDGKRDGKSIIWDFNRQIKSEKNYKDGKLDGKVI